MFCVYLYLIYNIVKFYYFRDYNDFRFNIFFCIEKVYEADEIYF